MIQNMFSRRSPYPSHEGYYPSGNSSFTSYFHKLKILAFKNSFPLVFPVHVALFGVSMDILWNLIYSNRMYWVNLTLILNSFQGEVCLHTLHWTTYRTPEFTYPFFFCFFLAFTKSSPFWNKTFILFHKVSTMQRDLTTRYNSDESIINIGMCTTFHFEIVPILNSHRVQVSCLVKIISDLGIVSSLKVSTI